MIVIVLTNCPPALRGDLTKWLIEVDINVFVGRVGARVRDQLWKRVKEHCDKGRATMAFNTNNEQHFDFKVHNSEWEPIDIDGFKLMLRPLCNSDTKGIKAGYSKASHYLEAKRRTRVKTCNDCDSNTSIQPDNIGSDEYIVLDVETTGLSSEKDKIIRLNALCASNNEITDSISIPIQSVTELPIMNDVPNEQKEKLSAAMEKLSSFIGNRTIVSHRVRFCMKFIDAACNSCGLRPFSNPAEDVEILSKKVLYNLRGHSIEDLAEHFKIKFEGHAHLEKCQTIMKIYDELMAMDKADSKIIKTK